MRILYFSSRECWPVNSGARLRDYHQARQLARHSSLTYVGLPYPHEMNSDSTSEPLPPPEQIFERMLRIPKGAGYAPLKLVKGLLGPTPVTVLNCTTPHIAAELAKLGREGRFDSIQMEGVHLVRYIPILRAFPSRPPIVCDWHNIESEIMRRYSENEPSLPRRLYARRTAGLIERAEAELLRSADAHTVCSAREIEKLRAVVPDAEFHVIENGVDTAYFSECTSAGLGEERRRIVFVASMDYHANIDAAMFFARDIWPAVSARLGGDYRFTIVGKNPPPQIRALQGQSGIEVTGTVPDVRPYYREALAVVVPLRVGGGTRLKILEAMAAGVPVVSTTLGAEGLEVDPGRDILTADTPAEMAEAIASLRDRPAQWQQISAAGRDLVARKYDWRILGDRLFSIHQHAVEKTLARA